MSRKIDLKVENNTLRGKPNSTFLWYSRDDEETFKVNLKKYPTDPTLLYYKKNPIKYTVNSNKFRTPDEFTLKETGNLFLGCSHTYGIGLHLEDTWAYKVNKTLGGKFWNLGYPGSSLQMSFLLLHRYHREMNIKNIFVYHPHLHRYQLFLDDRWYNIGSYNFSQPLSESGLSKSVVQSYMSDEYAYLNYLAYSNAIKNICNKLDIPVYFISVFPNVNFKTLPPDAIKARDLQHYPVVSHDWIADQFIIKHNSGDTSNYSEEDFNTSNEIEGLTKKTKM